MSGLRLFGARPANGVESVRAELEAYLTDEDALVVQTPHIPTFRGVLLTMLRVPAVTLGINLFALFVQWPVMLLRDRGFVWIAPSEYESMAGDRQTHFVGEHPLERIASVGWPVVLVNWVVLLGSGVLDWRSTLLMVGLGLLVSVTISLDRRQGYPRLAVGLFCVGFAVGVWLLGAGYLNPLLVVGFGVGAAATIGWTNTRLLSDVLDDAATVTVDHRYDEVCLVTNSASVTTLLEKAADTDLTVGDAFAQRRHGEGYHLDADGQPLDQPLLSHTDELLEERITAQFVDWAIVGGGLAVWLMVAGLTAGAGYIEWETTVVSGVPLTYTGLLFLSLAVPPTVYYTVTEGVWGQTVGKRVRDIRVVHTDGSSPGLRATFIRTLIGWFDFAPVAYVFGGARIAGDDYDRRFGDLAAGTIVVEAEAVRSDATDAEQSQDGVAAREEVGPTASNPQPSPSESTEPTAASATGGANTWDEAAPPADDSTTDDTPDGTTGVEAAGEASDGEPEDATPVPETDDDASAERRTEGTPDSDVSDESDTAGSRADSEWTATALDDEE